MSDRAALERWYRRLLLAYPRAFRRQNGPEILAVLMACAPDGQRRPSLAEAADLIRGGLWMRLRPGVPASARTVRAAVGAMYAGAAVSTVNLVILLAFIDYVKAYHSLLGHSLTPAQVGQLNTPFVTLSVISGLVPVALWLWMARENGQGRTWARSLSTVLFALATVDLTGAFRTPGIQLTIVPELFGPAIPVLTWLAGLAAVWLLWRPASTAYFKPHGLTPLPPARPRPSGQPPRFL
jgi:hypothetical protein